MDLQSLHGGQALITGASRGIGRRIAVALSALGCHLVLHARRQQHLAEVIRECSQAGVEVRTITAELGDPEQVGAMICELDSGYPPVDILYNNAAVMMPWHEDAWSIPASEFITCFQVNVISQVMLCQALVPGMIQRGRGRIVNLVSGIDRQPQLAPYAVTKAALEKYTHDIVPALTGTGVTMNALDPGWLRTDMGSEEAPSAVESVLPGALVPLFLGDDVCGERIDAQRFAGMDLQQAVAHATS